MGAYTCKDSHVTHILLNFMINAIEKYYFHDIWERNKCNWFWMCWLVCTFYVHQLNFYWFMLIQVKWNLYAMSKWKLFYVLLQVTMKWKEMWNALTGCFKTIYISLWSDWIDWQLCGTKSHVDLGAKLLKWESTSKIPYRSGTKCHKELSVTL